MPETNDQGHTAAAVELPPASVDFNALNDALAAGQSPQEALDAALVQGTVALSADEARANLAESIASAPTLGSMNKVELADVAAKEAVTEAKGADGTRIAFADATRAQMIEAIEAHRNGVDLFAPPAEPAQA